MAGVCARMVATSTMKELMEGKLGEKREDLDEGGWRMMNQT